MHVVSCPAYAELFREDPARCLDPAAEYVRYRTQDDTSEARAQRRSIRMQRRFAELDRMHATQAARWARPRDILED